VPEQAVDASHNVVPIGSCRYLDGSFAIPPSNDKPSLPFGAASTQLMKSVCPRPFTSRADGTPAPNTEWWVMGRFGPEKESVLGLNAWEEWVNVDFGLGVHGAIAIGCAPFSAILGVGYGVCFGIAEAAFEIALPLVKGSGHQRLPASARQSAVAVLALLLTATRRLMLTAAD
jgi:hypothetical protein